MWLNYHFMSLYLQVTDRKCPTWINSFNFILLNAETMCLLWHQQILQGIEDDRIVITFHVSQDYEVYSKHRSCEETMTMAWMSRMLTVQANKKTLKDIVNTPVMEKWQVWHKDVVEVKRRPWLQWEDRCFWRKLQSA